MTKKNKYKAFYRAINNIGNWSVYEVDRGGYTLHNVCKDLWIDLVGIPQPDYVPEGVIASGVHIYRYQLSDGRGAWTRFTLKNHIQFKAIAIKRFCIGLFKIITK